MPNSDGIVSTLLLKATECYIVAAHISGGMPTAELVTEPAVYESQACRGQVSMPPASVRI